MITLNDWPDGAVAHVQWVNRAKWVMVRGTAANSWDHPAPTFGLPPGTITIRPDPRFEQWALENSEKFAAQAELLSLRAIDAMNERDAALAQVAALTAQRDELKSTQKDEFDATDFLLRFAGIDDESVTTEGGIINVGKLRIRLDELAVERDEMAKDAARYRWWREHGPAIFEDPDGIPAAAFSCQIPLPDIESLSGAELIDLIADRCIAVEK